MTDSTAESRVRDRTRRSLIERSIEVLERNPSASLSDIADGAGVARSTLHRYFADRGALFEGIHTFAVEVYADTRRAARPQEGTAAEALHRYVGALFDAFDVLRWWLRSYRYVEGAQRADGYRDDVLAAILQRGRDEGAFDPVVPDAWATTLMWAGVHAAYALAEDGEATTRHARELCLESLERALRRPAAASRAT